jgi:GalNAc-alpha-(1->4)-GalNAc-alpha-(1->3)-diNAcBac-PP-undecaprenol alpha-1,4-N-acetyl-D-galactosaminyltransferase
VKILFVISSLRLGGAENVAATLCNYWADNNHQVTLLTLDSQENDFFKANEKVIRCSIDAYRSSRSFFDKIFVVSRRILRIRKVVKQLEPDVVVSFMDTNNILATLACLFIKIPVVITEHTYPPYYNNNNFFDIVRKQIYKLSSVFVTQTEIVSQWASKFLDAKRIEIIANPLDHKNLATNLDQPRSNKIIAVGRLCPEKGFDTLISTFNKIQSQYPNWELIIVGEGPERKSLEQQITALGLNHRVTLLGRVASPQAYYTSAKIFASSSRVEGFPMVLIEAMAHGLAVVSFDCASGPADIIDNGVNGLLVPAQDIDQLALGLKRLIDDEQLRNSLAKQAIRVRDKYSLDVVAQDWLKLFARLI